MKNFDQQFEFKKGSEVVEATKVNKLRVLWAEKGINPATLPQSEIIPLVKAEMTHEGLIKILELSQVKLSDAEFISHFGSWYKGLMAN